MKAFRYILGFLLILFGMTLLCGRAEDSAAKDYNFIGEYEQDSEVVVAIHGGVNKYGLWPPLWNSGQKNAAAHKGMKVFIHMRETGDDWMGVHIFVPQGDTLVIDPLTRIHLCLPEDGGEYRLLKSKEIILTNEPGQREMFSNSRHRLYLMAGTSPYYRAESGGFVAFIRFTKGALGLHHGTDIDRAGMPVPYSCRIVSDERR